MKNKTVQLILAIVVIAAVLGGVYLVIKRQTLGQQKGYFQASERRIYPNICIDSDGGINPEVAGSISSIVVLPDGRQRVSVDGDYCFKGKLLEYVCDTTGNDNVTERKCQFGCTSDNRACITEKPIKPYTSQVMPIGVTDWMR